MRTQEGALLRVGASKSTRLEAVAVDVAYGEHHHPKVSWVAGTCCSGSPKIDSGPLCLHSHTSIFTPLSVVYPPQWSKSCPYNVERSCVYTSNCWSEEGTPKRFLSMISITRTSLNFPTRFLHILKDPEIHRPNILHKQSERRIPEMATCTRSVYTGEII